MMDAEQLSELAVKALEDVKGQDIHVMDVREITSITDYMIIASGTSGRQVKALADNVSVECKKSGNEVLGMEGQEKAEWVLVDLGDVIVHVMQPDTRDFYQLEKLWTTSEDSDEEEDQEDQA